MKIWRGEHASRRLSRSPFLTLWLGLSFLLTFGCRTACPPSPRVGIPIHGLPGPEDFEAQISGPQAPRLLVASQEDAGSKQPAKNGEIIAIPLGGEGGQATLVHRHGDSCSFHPHGVSLVTASDGQLLLYLINHHDPSDIAGCLKDRRPPVVAGNVHSVEVYEILEDGSLRLHGDRLLDRLLTRPNDLAALPDGRIYVTNVPAHRTFGFLFEGLFGHSSSSVVMFDGKSWHRAALKPRIANGIAVDGARDRLYVAETAGKKIDVLAIDGPRAMAPVRVGEIAVGSAVDNLSWGPAGPEGRTLWAAAYRSNLAFTLLGIAWQHHRSGKPLSPSEVFRINLDGGSERAECIFSDDGQGISGASTAFPFGGNLYIGQVFDDFVLRYPCPDPIHPCSAAKEGR